MPISKKFRQQASNNNTTSPTSPSTTTTSTTTTPTTNPSISLPPSAPQTFTDTLPLPTTLIFDLDYTLWPFWVDTHVSGPLKPKDSGARVTDRWGESFAFYHDVPSILWCARERGLRLGLASRTHTPDLAREMLKLLVVVPPEGLGGNNTGGGGGGGKAAKGMRALDFFDAGLVQIFPGSKAVHFRRMVEREKTAGGGGGEERFKEMVFFDDEARNRNVETELGVCFRLVRDGVTRKEIDEGIREWRRRRGIKALEERTELE